MTRMTDFDQRHEEMRLDGLADEKRWQWARTMQDGPGRTPWGWFDTVACIVTYGGLLVLWCWMG